MVSDLLEKAFDEAAKLPQDEQRLLAAWILEELAADRSWDAAFTSSEEVLAELADEALTEHHAGRTRPLDADFS